MASPLVTVMTPVFNASDTLPWAVASVLAQTYEQWELIIVDDGSTDPVEPLVRNIADSRIRLFRNETNMGRGYCRGLALEMARGDYLAMVDADDWAYPWKLERQVKILEEHRNLVAVSNPMGVVNQVNEISGIRGRQSASPILLQGKGDLEPFRICFPATMFRMEAAKRSGFRKELRAVEDRDFMIRALAARDYAVYDEILYAYRHELGSSPNGTWKAYLSIVKETRRLLGFYKDAFPFASRMKLLDTYRQIPLWLLKWFLVWGVGLRFNRDMFPTSEQQLEFAVAYDIVAGTVKNHFDAVGLN